MEQEKILTANDYIKMAEECEQYKKFAAAKRYYQKAFELDPRQKSAQMGVACMEKEIANQVYFRTEATYNLVSGRLELRTGCVVFVGRNGVDKTYQLDQMENIRVALGRLTFDYPEEAAPIGISCKSMKDWIGILEDAKSGKYPNVENVGLNTLEKFIADHFSKDTMDDAVEYCTQMSVMGYAEAKAVVERIFL